MFQLKKTFYFEAGHCLKNHEGGCQNFHGHSYVLNLYLRSKTLHSGGPENNMVMDFKNLSLAVKDMIEKYFDHRWLNDTLEEDSPTAEYMTRWIYKYLKKDIDDLYSVEVMETRNAGVMYWED